MGKEKWEIKLRACLRVVLLFTAKNIPHGAREIRARVKDWGPMSAPKKEIEGRRRRVGPSRDDQISQFQQLQYKKQTSSSFIFSMHFILVYRECIPGILSESWEYTLDWMPVYHRILIQTHSRQGTNSARRGFFFLGGGRKSPKPEETLLGSTLKIRTH